MCLFDNRARPDFTKAHVIQQEQLAQLVSYEIDNWSIRWEMERLDEERNLLLSSRQKTTPPEGHAALIFTDVQGSTKLWELDADCMSEALQLHDRIMRKCITEHHGYEVATEGDAFHIAFHDAVDAVKFALRAQEELYNAPWSQALLELPDACDDAKGFRGLRIHMSIHYGEIACRDNEVSGQREYVGPAVNIAKSLEHMSHGGQILASSDVWNVVSFVAETSLGSPQVLDLGMHVLWMGKAQNEGIIAKGVVQLVPSSLAFSYSTHRRSIGSSMIPVKRDEKAAEDKGRQFPPPITQKCLSASFNDAPYANNEVTVVFVCMSEVEKLYDDTSVILAVIAKLIGTLLGTGMGYQCKSLMVAFSNESQAVNFGLTLQEYVKDNDMGEVSLLGVLKVGLHHGEFSFMGPNQTTGRADYFGRVVNRAARVAGAATPGEVYLGTFLEDKPGLEPGLVADFVGRRELKGVESEMALYSCCRTGKEEEVTDTSSGDAKKDPRRSTWARRPNWRKRAVHTGTAAVTLAKHTQ
jgi:class 3 adenylate cyclase